jgi:hypothetical protein
LQVFEDRENHLETTQVRIQPLGDVPSAQLIGSAKQFLTRIVAQIATCGLILLTKQGLNRKGKAKAALGN